MLCIRIFGVILLSLTGINAGIIVDNVEMCEPTANYDIIVTNKIRTENGIQILEENTLNTSVDLDDNTTIETEVYMFSNNEWIHFASFTNRFCNLITKFFSGMIDDFEKAAGLTETCPYPKGEYRITNLPLGFEKLDYSTLPRGRVKLVATLKDESEKILLCQVVEFTISD